MITSDKPLNELVNKGVILTGPGMSAPGARTLIVTGLHRSGTSLVASILRQAGIFMGSEMNDNVNEDEEIVKILSTRGVDRLQQLISERAANYGTWGFKFPMLCESLDPADMTLFSNPHVIVIFRDPIAVAVRNALSEYREPMREVRVAMDEQVAMLTFIERLQCPMLLLSYEKSILFPYDFVDAVVQFCGLPSSGLLRERLIQVIDPNRPSYIAQARRRYEGIIDGVTGGCLYGWCRLTASDDPVELELFVDGRSVLHFPSKEFRRDLLDAGLGSGNHSFALDIRKLGLKPDSIIRIKVAKYGIELENSGRRLGAYVESSPSP